MRAAARQVAGVDDLFNEKLRLVVEYSQFRELSADVKRKVPFFCATRANTVGAVPCDAPRKRETETCKPNVWPWLLPCACPSSMGWIGSTHLSIIKCGTLSPLRDCQLSRLGIATLTQRVPSA